MTSPKSRLLRLGSAKSLTRSGIGVLFPEPNMVRRWD
jgi:hypothetical protein